MAMKTKLTEMFAKIKEANSDSTAKKVAVVPGTYNVKCIGAEVKKSLKGNQMAMLTFSVIDGECKGGTVRQYTTIEDFEEENPWKYFTLVSAISAYEVNIEQVCSVAENMEEALAMATTKLGKKCEKSNPVVTITLTRKETGTTPDGKPVYRDFYTFTKVMNDEPANADTSKSANDEDSFYSALSA